MNKKSLIRNLIYAFSAQGISLILSVLMSMIVPKLLGVEDYSYWQLFIFYIGYVGFSHFGLTDGIYLRLGGSVYEELDYVKYKTQLVLSLLIQFSIAVVALFVFSLVQIESMRMTVLSWTFIYMLIFNAAGYLGYVFQAVNQTRVYSISIMIDRIIFIGFVLIAIVIRGFSFRYYIIGYTFSKSVALIYCIIKAKELVFAKFRITFDVIKDMVLSISIGAKLLFANIAGSLILGIGRQIIDSVWGITAFGRFSFSLSLTNFFLQFIGQVSMVLFPALRQTDKSKRNEIYSSLRDALGILLPIVFVAYYPMQLIFGIWLPDYKESLSYIAVLLPLCPYDGKMQMLCNTYFKVLRKENFLLFINAGAALISFIICSFSAHVLGSITAVVYSMVLSVALRSIISELYLARMLNKKVGSSIILESSLVLGFIISINVFGNGLGTIIFLGMYGVFLMANKGKIMNLIMLLKRK